MSARSKLLGSWECVSWKAINNQDESDIAYPFTEKIQGSVVYANDGYISAMLQDPNCPVFAAGPLEGTEAEYAKAASMVHAYHGQFFFEEDEQSGELKLFHQILTSLPANWIGTTQVRKCKMWEEGGELYMRLQPELVVKGDHGVERRVEVDWRKKKPNERTTVPSDFKISKAG